MDFFNIISKKSLFGSLFFYKIEYDNNMYWENIVIINYKSLIILNYQNILSNIKNSIRDKLKQNDVFLKFYF